MVKQKIKRVRGLVLSRQGWQKIQAAKTEWEFAEKLGEKLTLEEISKLSGLTTATIRKIMTREEGVDKRSIRTLFVAFNLSLVVEEDCTKPVIRSKLKSSDRRIDWGEAVDISLFFGRTKELTTLEQWIVQERCRLVSLIGIGGIGKTTLSIKITQRVESQFKFVIWRSLRDAPPIQEFLLNLIQFLSVQPVFNKDIPASTTDKITLLIECLRASRCLVVLDNIESLMDDASRAGICAEDHQKYSQLFQRLGESEHQSCILLTTREKPKEIIVFEGKNLPVRSIQLDSLEEPEALAILEQKGLEGTAEELSTLIQRYDGNPLSLKIVSTTIQDLFAGNVSLFLRQNTAIFGDLKDVLRQQFERLLNIETKIIYWLAINREPITLEQLESDLVDSSTKSQLLEGLESLARRCLIDKAEYDVDEEGVRFSLHSVVMEYVTSQLTDKICQEIITQEVNLLRYYALVKATAKDYIKEAQKRLILKPIVLGLFDFLGCQSNIEQQLLQIKSNLQSKSPRQTGYVVGNILNLLIYLGTDLTGLDCSNLCIWQADLQNVPLHNVSFQHADLAKTLFSETFSGVISVAFSPDGAYLAAGDSSGEIRLWSLDSNQPLKIFRGHNNWVTSIAFNSNGNLLASGSSDSNIKLWDTETNECLYTLKGHEGEVWSVAFGLDDDTLTSGSDDRTIKIWDLSTGQCSQTLEGHTSWVTSVRLSSKGKVLVSSSDDRTIRFWNLETGKCLRVLRGHEHGVRSLAFSQDEQTLISASDDHTLKLWDINTGKRIKTLTGHTNRVFDLAVSPTENIVASASHDRTVKLWNLDTGECIQTFEEHSNWVFSVAFHPHENLLASGSRDQKVKLWDCDNRRCDRTFQGYSNQILSVALGLDDRIVASASQDHTIRLWNINTGKCTKILKGHSNWVYSVAFDSQGNFLASSSEDKTVKLWNIETKECLITIRGNNATVRQVIFVPDSNILAGGTEDHKIKFWNANTGHVVKSIKAHEAAIWSIAVSPDGKMLASGSLDRTVKIWNIDTSQCLKTLEGHETWVWSVNFSPDGKTLVSSSPDGTLKFWDINTGKCTKNLKPSSGWLLATAFSPDGQMFAASSQDCTIKVWDTNTFELVTTFVGHQSGFIWSLAFCSQSQTIVSGSEDETIKLWSLETQNCLNTFKAEGLYRGLNTESTTGLSESSKISLEALKA